MSLSLRSSWYVVRQRCCRQRARDVCPRTSSVKKPAGWVLQSGCESSRAATRPQSLPSWCTAWARSRRSRVSSSAAMMRTTRRWGSSAAGLRADARTSAERRGAARARQQDQQGQRTSKHAAALAPHRGDRSNPHGRGAAQRQDGNKGAEERATRGAGERTAVHEYPKSGHHRLTASTALFRTSVIVSLLSTRGVTHCSRRGEVADDIELLESLDRHGRVDESPAISASTMLR